MEFGVNCLYLHFTLSLAPHAVQRTLIRVLKPLPPTKGKLKADFRCGVRVHRPLTTTTSSSTANSNFRPRSTASGTGGSANPPSETGQPAPVGADCLFAFCYSP
jgi:hypothetical protein